MKTFGIICAMDEEIKLLQEALTDGHCQQVGAITFYQGKIKHQPVVLVKSGIGKVEAGITAALLLTNFKIDVLIHSGSAAGIGENLQVGDVVLSTETAYHDVDCTADGEVLGQLPNQPARFAADAEWRARLATASQTAQLTVHQGLIVTGDQFIAGAAMKKRILTAFPDALAAEMEGAAVGQVAHQFKVPYVVVRAMSDVGDENANTSFNEFIVKAGQQAAQMLVDLLAAEPQI
ncbi:5'-methylthioadenosine nucleosidase [Fructilactobacillus florum 8D]|uniref:adenosylhomocysteine nucleosidase n=1 Tax=Fructilactobacillus florum 8D TaxID=1221538 RepID=W9EG74_9LACO|nr:5'-methylthioadenosine/adenosylhomocysteine nucleosidase [Fructilactobacillus florum]EKK20307.1 5'-methylthioadenosine nucleosidase [Fructilactobacillus florum 2F]ETO39980.1 5'-methylthioadenosine nucleosidase [Fructilactobacillus florum 8D]